MLNINELVDSDSTLTNRGWEATSKIAAAMDSGLNIDAQWATLFQFSEENLEGDEDLVMFFISITRKVYVGDITPRKSISVEI